ncbi:hypothetical protein D3C87_1346270 [compost metagenome]
MPFRNRIWPLPITATTCRHSKRREMISPSAVACSGRSLARSAGNGRTFRRSSRRKTHGVTAPATTKSITPSLVWLLCSQASPSLTPTSSTSTRAKALSFSGRTMFHPPITRPTHRITTRAHGSLLMHFLRPSGKRRRRRFLRSAGSSCLSVQTCSSMAISQIGPVRFRSTSLLCRVVQRPRMPTRQIFTPAPVQPTRPR